MPHLVQMDKRMRDDGLRIIGDEVQGSPKERIEAIAKEHKIEFPITRGTNRPPTMRGIPHAVVFDVNGQLVFAGHPAADEFERTVKKALREVDEPEEDGGIFADPKPLVASRDWTNSEGKTITAEVVRVEGDKVVFKMRGREIPYPLANLSEEDQATIRKAAEDKDGE